MLPVSSLGIIQLFIWDRQLKILGAVLYINLIFVCMEETTCPMANKNQPARFGDLQNGYLVVDSAIGDQFPFLHYPNSDVESEFSA
jgi:hypothetical protein